MTLRHRVHPSRESTRRCVHPRSISGKCTSCVYLYTYEVLCCSWAVLLSTWWNLKNIPAGEKSRKRGGIAKTEIVQIDGQKCVVCTTRQTKTVFRTFFSHAFRLFSLNKIRWFPTCLGSHSWLEYREYRSVFL